MSDSLTEYQELIKSRRESAAALWESIPHDQFDMTDWHCGTTACALGWLALKEHDGWKLNYCGGVSWGKYSYYTAAEKYFDLPNAYELFNSTGCFYHKSSKLVQPKDVASAVRSAPLPTYIFKAYD